MLLGFKNRFAPFILEGSKTHTIRNHRFIAAKGGEPKRVIPKPGELCHCYTGLRQKNPARLLGRFPFARLQEIRIISRVQYARAGSYEHAPALIVCLDDTTLTADEAESFFYRDGFRDDPDEMFKYPYTQQAAKFWREEHGADAFPFEGNVIHWKFPA